MKFLVIVAVIVRVIIVVVVYFRIWRRNRNLVAKLAECKVDVTRDISVTPFSYGKLSFFSFFFFLINIRCNFFLSFVNIQGGW